MCATCRWPYQQERILPFEAQYRDTAGTYYTVPSWPKDRFSDHGVSGQAQQQSSCLPVPETRIPSLRRQQSSTQSRVQQQSCSASQWSGSAGRNGRLRPTRAVPQPVSSLASKQSMEGVSGELWHSRLTQPTAFPGWQAHGRFQMYMPPERAQRLLRSLHRFPSSPPAHLPTKSGMLESYLQDAHVLSMEGSQPCVGDMAALGQETPAVNGCKSPTGCATVLHSTEDTPMSALPAHHRRLHPNRSAQGASASLVKHNSAAERMLLDGDAAASEWGWAPSVASTRKSRATAACSRNLSYAQMHLERIAER